MAKKRQTLESWINEAVNDRSKGDRCTMLVLVHMVGQAEREIHNVKFGSEAWTDGELGQLFQHKAESYVQDLPGVQTFCLLAFYNKTEPEARHPFVVNTELDFGGLSTEGPNNQGLVQQAMRHTEAMVQLSFRQTGMLFETQNRIMSTIVQQHGQTIEENRALIEALKEMLLQRATEDFTKNMELAKYQRESEERQKFLSMAPPLVNTILGHQVFPQSTEDTALIDTIANSLNEEQIMSLAKILPTEVLGLVMSRFEKAVKTSTVKQVSPGTNEDDKAAE